MPLTGNSYGGLDSPYFTTLEELDLWAAKPTKPLDAVLEYVPRPPSSKTRGKLLVCHDYKGGYTESPFSMAYTFNFWAADRRLHLVSNFSHHRWITAAHRQGVKMLGNLIFEGNRDEDDCLRLLVGRLPKSKTGPARPAPDFRSLPLSPHYARLLADLAHQRGFDGYLLNFECPLRGGVEQTRALAAWITLLVDELKSRIGSHAEVIWYDSVVITGQLAWQDRLNGFNLPFFLSSTSFFTNYTWSPSHTDRTVEYFRSLAQTASHVAPKALHDIYVGIDVFGRGSHGGGGFGAYKALEHIAPTGMSTAFFGPGWTWENTQDMPSFTWESWFEDERRLWAGPRAGERVDVPISPPNRSGELACEHGAFSAVRSFFAHAAPPDPRSLPLHTTFCAGVGRSWWVDGVRVFQRPGRDGWTDIDKQTSVGDLVWPVPLLAWEGDDARTDALPAATSEITLDEAWNGGSALRLGISAPGEEGEDSAFRCVWVPVQSVTVTQGKLYEATAVYRIEQEDANVDLDIALSVKVMTSPSTYSDGFDVAPQSVSIAPLPGGWTKLCIRFESSTPLAEPTLHAALGLLVSIDFDPAKAPNAPLDGTLSWEVAATFRPLPILTLSGAEDANSAWPLAPSAERWFPRFLYFNIYAQRYAPGAPANLPFELAGVKTVTFYVQGVTDRGEVLRWDQCVFIDVFLP
ncbi:glycosyl hydrolase family 85-domain-containing protein [Mycena metata]|uniref:Glycosyl hydrolase family 85-domain-containing protein n=1 Tax=Mycena metata TaxID=1033252 RepID=A0AAD7J399_9AGAR|nr:glycosyl hydrolase family 85-domain-containing protein [Mycena metata]